MKTNEKAVLVASLVMLGCTPSKNLRDMWRTPDCGLAITFYKRSWTKRPDKRWFAVAVDEASRRSRNIQDSKEVLDTVLEQINRGQVRRLL
jgi:hypothetical protein